MSLIGNIKDYFGLAKLKSLLSKKSTRQVSFCNLNNAKTIGLIVALKDEADYKRIMSFIKVLKGDYGVRNVSALAFYQDSEEPLFLKSKLSFDFFLETDLSWRKEPLKLNCKSFVDENFDILIDLTDSFSIPLRHLLLVSSAKFKVGRYSEVNTPYYDFMIDSEHSNFNQFTQEAIRYLTMINEK